MPIVTTTTALQTKTIAKEIWGQLGSQPTIIALEGELGAGKTVFVKGLIGDDVTSPSFVLHIPYKIGNKTLHHIDAWRMDSFSELEKLGLAEMLVPNSVVIIEWADRFEKEIKRLSDEEIKIIWVKIGYGKNKNGRRVEYSL